jgi:ribosome biogenesis protein Tsr3
MDKQMAAEGEVQAASNEEQMQAQMQQQQMQQDAETKAANNQAKQAQKEKSTPQKLEIKVKHEVPGAKKSVTKEELVPFVPKALTEEDKKLIESMTRAIEKVSKEDLDEVEEEIKDAI